MSDMYKFSGEGQFLEYKLCVQVKHMSKANYAEDQNGIDWNSFPFCEP